MTLSANKTQILAKVFRHGCRNYFLHVQKYLLKTVFFSKKFHSFLMTWTKKFRPSSKMISERVIKTSFKLCEGFFRRKKSSFMKKFFVHFRTLLRNFSIFCQNFSGMLSKLLSTCPENTFQEYICSGRFCFFSLDFGIVQKFIVISSKKIGKVDRTGF